MVDTTGSEMKPRQREAEDGVTPKVGVEMEGQEKNTPRIEAMETEFGCGRQPGGSAGRRVGLREELKTQIGPQDLAETSRAGRGRLVAGGELRRDNRKMRTRGGRAGRRREPAAAARGSARTGTRASRFCTARQACAPSRGSSACSDTRPVAAVLSRVRRGSSCGSEHTAGVGVGAGEGTSHAGKAEATWSQLAERGAGKPSPALGPRGREEDLLDRRPCPSQTSWTQRYCVLTSTRES